MCRVAYRHKVQASENLLFGICFMHSILEAAGPTSGMQVVNEPGVHELPKPSGSVNTGARS